jgi:hypothetical protein
MEMDSALTGEAVVKEVENKVLEILREKCKRVLSLRTEEDYCYGLFLEAEGFLGISYIKLKETETKHIKVFARAFHMNMELKDQIDELQDICLKWNFASIEWKMLHVSLLDRYDFIRSNINKYYSEDIKRSDCKEFIEEIKIITRECFMNSLGITPKPLLPNERKRAVYQLTKEGVFLIKHESIAAAGKAVGTRHTSRISECCSGKHETACGYKWEYAH